MEELCYLCACDRIIGRVIPITAPCQDMQTVQQRNMGKCPRWDQAAVAVIWCGNGKTTFEQAADDGGGFGATDTVLRRKDEISEQIFAAGDDALCADSAHVFASPVCDNICIRKGEIHFGGCIR